MRKRFVYDRFADKVIPIEEAGHLFRQTAKGPNIIGDIAETRSMLDGKVYTSRRHYRDHVKAHGCEIVGNDLNNQPMSRELSDAPGLRDDIQKAFQGN